MANETYKKLRGMLIDSRKAAALSQTDLAKRLKRPQSFVSKYERGERSLDVVELRDVAVALGIDPIRLVQKLYRESK